MTRRTPPTTVTIRRPSVLTRSGSSTRPGSCSRQNMPVLRSAQLKSARRPELPGMPCPPPTRQLRACRRGRRWLRSPCAGRQAHRRSHEKTSAAPDRTSRQRHKSPTHGSRTAFGCSAPPFPRYPRTCRTRPVPRRRRDQPLRHTSADSGVRRNKRFSGRASSGAAHATTPAPRRRIRGARPWLRRIR